MRKLSLLIVDDEPGMRLGAVKALRNYQARMDSFDQDFGFELLEAEDGESALKILEQRSCDLLLLDYKLPGISGLEVLGALRERNYDMLTIMMTAYASLEVAVSATKNGAFDFLAKPFTPQELKSVVLKTARSLLLQRQARQLAEEKRQVRFQFLSVLSHELKAPLNAIDGYLRIVKDRVAGDKLEDYDNILDRSILRVEGMRKLIFDLLDLTRIESGQKKREIAEVDAVAAARTAIENLSPDAAARGITIQLAAPDTATINGDVGELEIIFNNLVSNAVKYNKDNGRVDVSIKPFDGGVAIDVADTGIGMDKDEVARLFGEFVRIKNEKTKNILGSGLGLSILKRLAGMYEGAVTVKSAPDAGTTFSIKLMNLNQ